MDDSVSVRTDNLESPSRGGPEPVSQARGAQDAGVAPHGRRRNEPHSDNVLQGGRLRCPRVLGPDRAPHLRDAATQRAAGLLQTLLE